MALVVRGDDLSRAVLVAWISGGAVVLAALIAGLFQRSTRKAIHRAFEPVNLAMDTKNNRPLADYVHDTSGAVEAMSGQLHETKGELLKEILSLHHKADRSIELASDVQQRLDDHIAQGAG